MSRTLLRRLGQLETQKAASKTSGSLYTGEGGGREPSWWTKSRDPTIRAKWQEEATSASPPYGEIPLDQIEVKYVLDELSWYAARHDEETGIEVSFRKALSWLWRLSSI